MANKRLEAQIERPLAEGDAYNSKRLEAQIERLLSKRKDGSGADLLAAAKQNRSNILRKLPVLVGPTEDIICLMLCLVKNPKRQNVSLNPVWWLLFFPFLIWANILNKRIHKGKKVIVVITSTKRLMLIQEEDMKAVVKESVPLSRIREIRYDSVSDNLVLLIGKKAWKLKNPHPEGLSRFVNVLTELGAGSKIHGDIGEIPHLFEFAPADSTDAPTANMSPKPRDDSKAGYIYILINPALGTEVVKIGGTTRTPEERAEELFSTGVPSEFVVAYEEHTPDWLAAESEIHRVLRNYRLSDSREFFKIPLKDAVRAVSEIARSISDTIERESSPMNQPKGSFDEELEDVD